MNREFKLTTLANARVTTTKKGDFEIAFQSAQELLEIHPGLGGKDAVKQEPGLKRAGGIQVFDFPVPPNDRVQRFLVQASQREIGRSAAARVGRQTMRQKGSERRQESRRHPNDCGAPVETATVGPGKL